MKTKVCNRRKPNLEVRPTETNGEEFTPEIDGWKTTTFHFPFGKAFFFSESIVVLGRVVLQLELDFWMALICLY